tara:strand:- start:15 stop:293 length:279 start_codon:yes stop_codon:yes gene_type:complete
MGSVRDKMVEQIRAAKREAVAVEPVVEVVVEEVRARMKTDTLFQMIQPLPKTKRGLKNQKPKRKLLQRKKQQPKNLSRFSKIAKPQRFQGIF